MIPSVGTTDKMTKRISESDVAMFAEISGDRNPIHLDDAAAQKSIFGERIAHGALVSGLLSAVIGMKLPGQGTIYMEQDSKFLKPVKLGDTITAIVEVAEVINAEKGVLKLNTRCINQDGDMVLDGYAVVKILNR